MKNIFTLSGWMKLKRLQGFFISPDMKKKTRSFQASLWAIIFGFVLAIIFVYINGFDGFNFLGTMFTEAFDNTQFGTDVPSALDKTLQYFSVYMLFGLGIAVGFKLGLFNMGGSGQALLGLGLSLYVLNKYANDHNISMAQIPQSYAINVVLLFIVSGIVISSIAGILKAFLNIHEVVTTVMLNWTIYYFVKWLDSKLIQATGTGTLNTENSAWLDLGGNHYMLGLIIALLSIFAMWIVLSFTTFGYKFKVVGAQPTAAKYAGIRTSFYIVLTTAIQGLFIGIGAVFFYFQTETTQSFQQDIVPTIGFDAIAIPLIAFNNLLGVIPVAFLWAIIKESSILIPGDLNFIGFSPYMGSLAFGLIVYGSAIYLVFTKLRPINLGHFWYVYYHSWQARADVYKLKRQIRLVKTKYAFYQYDSDLLLLKNAYHEAKANYQATITSGPAKSALDEALKNYKENQNPNTKALLSQAKIGCANSCKNAKVVLEYAKTKYQFEKKSQKEMIRSVVKTIRNDIRQLRITNYNHYVANSVGQIRRNFVSYGNEELYSTFDEITIIISDAYRQTDELKAKYHAEVKHIKKEYAIIKATDQKSEIIKVRKAKLKVLRDQFHTDIATVRSKAADAGFKLRSKYYAIAKEIMDKYKVAKSSAAKEIKAIRTKANAGIKAVAKNDVATKKVAEATAKTLKTNLKTEVQNIQDSEKYNSYLVYADAFETSSYNWFDSQTYQIWNEADKAIERVVMQYGRI